MNALPGMEGILARREKRRLAAEKSRATKLRHEAARLVAVMGWLDPAYIDKAVKRLKAACERWLERER